MPERNPPGSPDASAGRITALLKTGLRIAIIVVVIVMITRIIRRDWDELSSALSAASARYLALAFLCFICANLTIVFCWHSVLRILGSKPSFMTSFRSYFYSGMTKYIPGKIWGTTFRIVVSGKEGVPEGTAALGVLFETILLIASAGLIGGIAFSQLNLGIPVSIRWLSLLSPLTLLLLHPAILRISLLWLGKRYARLFSIPSIYPDFRDLLLLLWLYCGIWVCNGLGLFFLAASVREPIMDEFVSFVAGSTLAWLAGFVTVITPAGLGIREIVLTSLIGPMAGPGFAALMAVMSRIMMIGAEILGAVISVVHQLRNDAAP